MSGTAGVGTLFASAVTATGAQLDANFNTIVTYINNPTNRNNYVADGAATNTVNLTFSPAVVGGYTAGLELTWKWGQTNTGATVMNANGLGNVNLVNIDGTSLQAGQGVQGSIGKAVYDGTQFVYLNSFGTPASAAQASAAVSIVTFMSPGRMANSPGVAKAWASFNATSTGTITPLSSHNVARVVHAGVGTWAVVLTTPMAAAYSAICTTGIAATGMVVFGQGASTCTVVGFNTSTGAAGDAIGTACVTIFGTQ